MNFNQFNTIIVIGFGASSLNVRALLSAKISHKINVKFIDSLDPLLISKKLSNLDVHTSLMLFISKSGKTHETNLLLKEFSHFPNIAIISSNHNSPMREISKTINHIWIEYPESISGRFAILETPFLDIATACGINATKILAASKNIDPSQATKIANRFIDNFKLVKHNWIIFNYSEQIKGLLLWIRQIIGESLGKNGFGILPVLCNGSMDEHSQLQLFLDGPDDKFYDIISTNYHQMNPLSEAQINHAQMTKEMLESHNRDVIYTHHDEINEELVGTYIGLYAQVVKEIANRLGYDPYNQPAVEKTKDLSRS